MEPLLLFSERERRADRRAKYIIVAVFSAVCYALLWKWGCLGWSAARVTLVVAVPLLFGFFAITNNPVELCVVCVIVVGLVAMALPTYRHVQEKKKRTEELRKQYELQRLRSAQ